MRTVTLFGQVKVIRDAPRRNRKSLIQCHGHRGTAWPAVAVMEMDLQKAVQKKHLTKVSIKKPKVMASRAVLTVTIRLVNMSNCNWNTSIVG